MLYKKIVLPLLTAAVFAVMALGTMASSRIDTRSDLERALDRIPNIQYGGELFQEVVRDEPKPSESVRLEEEPISSK